jgi:hypothetical protein
MSFARTIIAGILLALATAHPALADDKEYLGSLYSRLGMAIANRDVEGYMALVDPGAVSVDAKGNSKNAQTMRAELSQLVPKIRNFRVVFAFDNLNNTGTRITALVKTATYFEAQAGANDWKPLLVIDASDDTWEQKAGSWKLVSTKTIYSESKEVPPDIARQLTSGGGAQQNARPQPGNQLPQQRPAQQPPATSRPQANSNSRQAQQLMYDSCMRHCATQSLNCSMSTGNYIGGKNPYSGVPCFTSQSGCEIGCKITH